MVPGRSEHIHGLFSRLCIMSSRPPRKIIKATASKIKKAMTSKRQRDSDDSDDVDYAPNVSEMAAASSVGDTGDECSSDLKRLRGLMMMLQI